MSLYNRKINPLIALLSGVLIMVFGLVTATRVEGSYFLIAVFLYLMLFGYYKECFRVLPLYVIVGGIFVLITYIISNNSFSALKMANRFGAIFLAIVPGIGIEPVRMTRNLSQIHTPRVITLGMLIALSFVPTLKIEVKRVREAMKTRGAGSILNPKIFYRAFLIPFVMRLINISDTLSLSVELRGFTIDKSDYTVYKKEVLNFKDIIYILALIVGMILVVVL